MGRILDEGQHGRATEKQWIKAHPDRLNLWLKDVAAFDGALGIDAVRASLKL